LHPFGGFMDQVEDGKDKSHNMNVTLFLIPVKIISACFVFAIPINLYVVGYHCCLVALIGWHQHMHHSLIFISCFLFPLSPQACYFRRSTFERCLVFNRMFIFILPEHSQNLTSLTVTGLECLGSPIRLL
jgi:hypothetical protein